MFERRDETCKPVLCKLYIRPRPLTMDPITYTDPLTRCQALETGPYLPHPLPRGAFWQPQKTYECQELET